VEGVLDKMKRATHSSGNVLPCLNLCAGRVVVWRLNLADAGIDLPAAWALLDEAERARALRFKVEGAQRRFVLCRATLRRLLGSYLAVAPEVVEFRYGPTQKPYLGGRWAGAGLFFNLAHSGDWAALAFNLDGEVGVDVEAMRLQPDLLAIARRFFTPQEAAPLAELPPAEQVRTFYTVWSRKEAFIKMTGKGLSQPLHTFSVSTIPGVPSPLLWVEGVDDPSRRWAMADLAFDAGYVGAVVYPAGASLHVCNYTQETE
jgi:4'-phosphopantetheinyl transferase